MFYLENKESFHRFSMFYIYIRSWLWQTWKKPGKPEKLGFPEFYLEKVDQGKIEDKKHFIELTQGKLGRETASEKCGLFF